MLTPEIKQIEYVSPSACARRDASPGIEFTGAVNSVSAEELKGHPKVKRVAMCQKKRSSLGDSMPAGWEQWSPGRSGGMREEKVSRKGHVRVNGGYRSANLAESTFKSSPAFTDCSKKLLNFLCDLTVFLSG